MSTKEARNRAIMKYQRKMIVPVKVNLHKEHDADIIEKLDTVPSKQGYIKECIRKDIREEEKE